MAVFVFPIAKAGPVKNYKRDIKNAIVTGASQVDAYIDYLAGKSIGVVCNQTSVIGKKHLVDTLVSKGIRVGKIFAPEHGFRGNYSAGKSFKDTVDIQTGIKVVSLYGRKMKPTRKDLADVDLIVFDIQDVGCRFYTYINLLRDVMESCAENEKELLILDRPNPNGYLIDGPVLDTTLKSGIGQFPIPISYGMTIGEFALMINGERWLRTQKCRMRIISLKNYEHDMDYILPIPPSPNLNTQLSIALYPSTCLFEGTFLSHGRGTMYPFTIIGSPCYDNMYKFSFTPTSIPGMCETPIYQDIRCYGIDLRDTKIDILKKTKRINLEWMIELYQTCKNKDSFFSVNQNNVVGNIDALVGDRNFKEQIKSGKTVEEIRLSWEPMLTAFKKKREKYLLYR